MRRVCRVRNVRRALAASCVLNMGSLCARCCVGALATLLPASTHTRRMRVSIMVRSSVMHFIFSKALVLTPTARQANSLGQMVNLMQLDTEKLLMAVFMIHQSWSAVLTVCLLIGSIYFIIGPATFAGVGVIFLLVPITINLANLQRVYQRAVRAVFLVAVWNGAAALCVCVSFTRSRSPAHVLRLIIPARRCRSPLLPLDLVFSRPSIQTSASK